MNICKIGVITLGDYYEENCYGLAETVARVDEIQNCDNVIGVEVISMETGEVLYVNSPFTETYVSPAFVVDLAEEILSQGLTNPLTLCYNNYRKRGNQHEY